MLVVLRWGATASGRPAIRATIGLVHRSVAAILTLDVLEPTACVFSIAVAKGPGLTVDDVFEAQLDGIDLDVVELVDAHGTRLHTFPCNRGRLSVRYTADVSGRATPLGADAVELIRCQRPSRYSESDTLHPVAVAEFAGLEGHDLLAAVSSWVGTQVAYISGSSQPTDGAVQTYLSRQGVCRDFAHLCVALLRAMDVPARLVSVYAPGLDPMDFHAVCEANLDGEWYVVDATTLAPRSTLVRIATGRDAADTAWVTTNGGAVELVNLTVSATADTLPDDDVTAAVQLG